MRKPVQPPKPKSKPYVPPMPPSHIPTLVEGSAGWMAPPNAAMECEQKMEQITRELSMLGSEVDRYKHVGKTHESMVKRMRDLRAELRELCADYKTEHAKLKGGHRADGWTRPDRQQKVPRQFRLKYGGGVALTVEAYDEKSALEKGRVWVVAMDPSEVIDLGVKL